MVDDAEVHVLRQEVFPDALGDVRVDLVLVEDARLFVFLEHGPVGVDAPDFDLGVAFLQVPADAADRAAGADADDEVRDSAVGLFPDFRPGLFVMRPGIGQVVVLVGFPGTCNLARQPGRHRIVRPRIRGIDVGRTDDDLGAECLQRVDLLLRLLISRREDASIALDDGHDGDAHAGAAGRAFDEGPARPEQARALRVLDHRDCDAIFDGIPRVERLELDQDFRVDDAAGDPVDSNHRSAADGVEDGITDFSHAASLMRLRKFSPRRGRGLTLVTCVAAIF